MENKQTAVEWLIEQLQAPCRGIPSHIIEQAKAMEKQQIIDAIGVGSQFDRDYLYGYHNKAEQYYNETFKSE